MQHFKQIPGYSNFSVFAIEFLCSKSGLWTQKCQSWKRYKNTPGTRNVTQNWLKWQKEGLKRVLSLGIVKHSDAFQNASALLSKIIQCWRCQTFSAGTIWLVLPWSTGRVQRYTQGQRDSTPSNFLLLTFPEYLGTFRCKNLTRWTSSLFGGFLPN